MTLNSAGKTDEAMVLIRSAIAAHESSPTCWHVQGMIQRGAEDYLEAMKSYRQALRMKPDNNGILRDMALLQIHTRDIDGFRDTQHKMLTSKSGSETNWSGFALGLHLTGYTDLAVHVLSKYEDVLSRTGKRNRNSACTELTLLKSRMREEQGNVEGALAELEGGWDTIVDKHDAGEVKARLLSLLGRWEEAGAQWKALLTHVNPDNYLYHRGVIASILQPEDVAAALAGVGTSTPVSSAEGAAAVSDEQLRKLLTFYDGAAAAAKRCKAHKRVPLDFLPAEHSEFAPRLTAYLRAGIQKGIPSLYQDIKRLYTHPGKAAVIGAVLDKLHAEAEAAVAALRAGTPLEGGAASGAPTDVMWALANKAAHERRTGNAEAALALAEAALTHSPTVIELYSLKARCLKCLGRLQDAADTLEMARGLDLADRHINTKCVKYMLAAGRTGPAADTMALFARQEGDPLFNIIDMQHLWYCIHSADAYAAEGAVALALKRYHNVHAHFNTFIEDQFDFHQYVLRRVNLRVYLDFLAWVDGLHSQPFYVRALAGLAKQYLYLAAHPELKVDEDGLKEPSEAALAAMEPAERKKAKNAYKNAKKKAEAARAEAAAGGAAAGAGGGSAAKKGKKPPKKDEDPHGYKYLATEDPLEKAAQFAQMWLASEPRNAEAGLLSAQVALKRGKAAAAAQGLAVAAAAATPPAGLAEAKAELQAWLDGPQGAEAHAAVRAVAADVLAGKLVVAQE